MWGINMMRIYNGSNTLYWRNVQEMTSLRHRCTHIADWITTRVTLKKIVNDDFHQVNYFKRKMQIILLTCLASNTKIRLSYSAYSIVNYGIPRYINP